VPPIKAIAIAIQANRHNAEKMPLCVMMLFFSYLYKWDMRPRYCKDKYFFINGKINVGPEKNISGAKPRTRTIPTSALLYHFYSRSIVFL
jgi:hypothetical protein